MTAPDQLLLGQRVAALTGRILRPDELYALTVRARNLNAHLSDATLIALVADTPASQPIPPPAYVQPPPVYPPPQPVYPPPPTTSGPAYSYPAPSIPPVAEPTGWVPPSPPVSYGIPVNIGALEGNSTVPGYGAPGYPQQAGRRTMWWTIGIVVVVVIAP